MLATEQPKPKNRVMYKRRPSVVSSEKNNLLTNYVTKMPMKSNYRNIGRIPTGPSVLKSLMKLPAVASHHTSHDEEPLSEDRESKEFLEKSDNDISSD